MQHFSGVSFPIVVLLLNVFIKIFVQIIQISIQAKFWHFRIFLNILTVADSTRAGFLFEAEVTALNYFPKEGSVVHNYEMPEYLNIISINT